jgi:hypothetical protein
MFSYMILAAPSIVTTVVLKNGLPRMRGVYQQTNISSTTKPTGTKEFLIFTGISSAIPTGDLIY